MSFGGHSPKPGRPTPDGQPLGDNTTDSGDSTPRAEGGQTPRPDGAPRVSLADYERLKEVVKRLSRKV